MKRMIANDLFLDKYVRSIKSDYSAWMTRVCSHDGYGEPEAPIKRFHDSVDMSFGTKYIKITSGGSAHSFIVNTDKDAKFKKGDILMAASWAAPARNKARGNIEDATYPRVKWNGVS